MSVGSTVIDVEIPVFWLAAAESVATQASWSTLKLLDAQAVKDLVDLAPTGCVPDGFAVTASDIFSPEWLSVSTAARPLLLLVRNVVFLGGGYRGIVHPPSDDEGTERTWFESEQRPRKRVSKRSVHGEQSPRGASKTFWRQDDQP